MGGSMRKTIMAALAAASLITLAGCKQTAGTGNEASGNASAATAAASIDGTWKADIDSVQFDQKPDEYLLQAGQYSCKSCVPSYTVSADGAFHPVSLPYADSIAVKVVDDHNVVRTVKKGGRQIGETKMTVSADGNTLSGSFNDTSVPNAPPGKGEFTETRVGPAPAGTHAVSGEWKPAKLSNFNPESLTISLKVDGDTFHFSSPSGYSYDAKIGGADVPIKGDIAGTTAAISKSGESYVETDKRGGKVVGTTTFTAGSDGKLHVVGEDKLSGSKTTWTATKA
jgi:hypothetical protein